MLWMTFQVGLGRICLLTILFYIVIEKTAIDLIGHKSINFKMFVTFIFCNADWVHNMPLFEQKYFENYFWFVTIFLHPPMLNRIFCQNARQFINFGWFDFYNIEFFINYTKYNTLHLPYLHNVEVFEHFKRY